MIGVAASDLLGVAHRERFLAELSRFWAEDREMSNRSLDGEAWTAADDLLLRRIAEAGLSGLSNMINGAPGAAPAPTPALRGPAVASAEPVTTAEGAFGGTALGFSSQ